MKTSMHAEPKPAFQKWQTMGYTDIAKLQTMDNSRQWVIIDNILLYTMGVKSGNNDKQWITADNRQ